MPTKKHGIVIETPKRGKRTGPSMLALLTISAAFSAPSSAVSGRILSKL